MPPLPPAVGGGPQGGVMPPLPPPEESAPEGFDRAGGHQHMASVHVQGHPGAGALLHALLLPGLCIGWLH